MAPEAGRSAEAALRESEEFASLIIDSATDYAIFTTDREGRVTSWSAGAAAIFGWSEAEIVGQSVDVLFTPEDRAVRVARWEAAVASRTGCAPDERWHVRKDGSRFFAAGSVRPLHHADGKLRGFLKVLRDATQRRQMEELLRERVQRQDIRIREVSHRVKNSLAMVAGLLGMQARAAKDAHVRSALKEAEDRVVTIAQVHDQLWRQPEIEHVDLAKFLGDLCAKLQEQAPAHDVLFSATPVTVPADHAIPLGLIVNELVTNAIKYAYPNGSGEVRVDLSATAATLRLEVADRGVGLPIGFDLAMLDDSLGMRVIVGMARQLRAKVEATSGQPGTRFVIKLPRGSDQI